MKNHQLTLFAILLVAVGFVLSFQFGPIPVWGAMTVAFAVFALIGHPKTLIYLVVIWAFFGQLAEVIFFNPLVSKVDELLILGMLAVYLGQMALRRVKSVPLVKLYSSLIFFSLLSMVLNRTSAGNFGLMFIAYFSAFIAFAVIYLNIELFSYKNIINMLLVIYVINLVLNLGWGLGINPIYNKSLGSVDFAKGSLGGCNFVAYFTIFIFAILFSLIHYEDEFLKKIKYGLIVLCGVIQFYFSYTAHAYLLLLFLIPVYFIATKRKLTIKIIVVGGLLFSMFMGVLSLNKNSGLVGDADLASELSASNIESRFRSFLTQPKVAVFNRVVVDGMDDGVLQWFIGHGPGSGTGGIARNHPTPYTFSVLGDYYMTQSGQKSMAGGSVSQSPFSGITSIWSELGLLGFGMFFGLYMFPTFRVFKQLRANRYKHDRYQRVLAEGFVVYGVLFLMINVLMDLLVNDYFVLLYWVLAALAWRPVMETDNSQPSEPTLAGDVSQVNERNV